MILDSHAHPEGWGIRPVLFEIAGLDIPAYATFVLLGLLTGLFVCWVNARQDNGFDTYTRKILTAGLVFGILGAKVPTWVGHYQDIFDGDMAALLAGRTIIGGILGGVLGVLLVKKYYGIKERKGNSLAPGIAIGIGIGRIGCFLAGCCYGIPTSLPWGVNFGDGVLRHPTQLYEARFCFGLFIYLMIMRRHSTEPGALFKRFMVLYLTFRFCIEFIRVEPIVFAGLTGFQYACLAGIVYVYRDRLLLFIHMKRGVGYE